MDQELGEAYKTRDEFFKKKNIEELGNRLNIEQKTGQKVQYGQTIQLK